MDVRLHCGLRLSFRVDATKRERGREGGGRVQRSGAFQLPGNRTIHPDRTKIKNSSFLLLLLLPSAAVMQLKDGESVFLRRNARRPLAFDDDIIWFPSEEKVHEFKSAHESERTCSG